MSQINLNGNQPHVAMNTGAQQAQGAGPAPNSP
jgi:hypothetical protein